MKFVYCSNCGKKLNIFRKALPKYGTIVNLVEYHECTEEPVEFDLTPVDVPTYTLTEGKDKFVQKLNELAPPRETVFERNIGDRRSEGITKSTAPKSVLGVVQSIPNTQPTHNIVDPEEDS